MQAARYYLLTKYLRPVFEALVSIRFFIQMPTFDVILKANVAQLVHRTLVTRSHSCGEATLLCIVDVYRHQFL